MSLVMKKYRYNHKDYLVYERNLLAREFDANEWQTICNNDLGVGADFIIEIINTQIFAYDMYGQKIDLNQDILQVIDYHEGILKDNNIPNEINVRTKNIYGIYKRLRQGEKLSDIHDLFSLKIMVDEIDDCYRE